LNTFGTPNLVSVLIGLAILLVVFLLVREVLCWYWKINKAISLLTEIRDLLAKGGVASMPSTSTSGPSAGAHSGSQREPTM
jgi:uncharacterized membrane protein